MRHVTGLALALLAASPAYAESWDFMLINDAGKSVTKIEVAPADSTDWTERLAEEGVGRKEVIKPKERTTVRFDRASNQCRYALRLTFEDASTEIFGPTNVCDNSYVTVRFAGGKPVISAN
jgi:hypothetical protein